MRDGRYPRIPLTAPVFPNDSWPICWVIMAVGCSDMEGSTEGDITEAWKHKVAQFCGTRHMSQVIYLKTATPHREGSDWYKNNKCYSLTYIQVSTGQRAGEKDRLSKHIRNTNCDGVVVSGQKKTLHIQNIVFYASKLCKRCGVASSSQFSDGVLL